MALYTLTGTLTSPKVIAPVQMRDKRDASKTPEPVPASVPELHPGGTAGQSFVIQEHHARNLH